MNKTTFLTILAALTLWSCENIEPILDNPLDPDNSDYESPLVTIISGPEEGEIIGEPQVTFAWEGNELVTLFRYRFTGYDWTESETTTSKTFNYLDEGDYQFLVQSEYESGDTSEVRSISFNINAVTGPALMFYPRRHEAQVGETVTFQILAEEVSNLAAAEFSISYDPDEIEITAIYEGSIFTDLGNVFFLVDNGSEGEATISTAVWGESSPSAEGTGVLAALEVKAKVTGSLVVSFDGSAVFKDPENSDIQINDSINGLVMVE